MAPPRHEKARDKAANAAIPNVCKASLTAVFWIPLCSLCPLVSVVTNLLPSQTAWLSSMRITNVGLTQPGLEVGHVGRRPFPFPL